ncbi:MAG: hypothetical protein ACIPMY_01870 [Rickettsia endosymbiont of Pentastiridius leporinus]
MRTVKEMIAAIEPYLDFIVKDRELLREIYPKGFDRNLDFEFILAQKPYGSYVYYITQVMKVSRRNLIWKRARSL